MRALVRVALLGAVTLGRPGQLGGRIWLHRGRSLCSLSNAATEDDAAKGECKSSHSTAHGVWSLTDTSTAASGSRLTSTTYLPASSGIHDSDPISLSTANVEAPSHPPQLEI